MNPRYSYIKSRKKRWLYQGCQLVVITLLGLGLLLGGFAIYTVRRSFPQVSGTIPIPGLKAEVTVQRDQWGVPHIYASNTHDLFMVQGYVHAQDRFWQMDFWRHIGSGRLAEIFGKSQVETDKYLRTMGWDRVAQQEIQQMDGQMQADLQAYADGVNAYLAEHQGSALSLEYAVLQLLNPRYKPEPWQPLHSLTWGKVMAYDLGRNFQSEIERTILLKSLSPQQVEELFPPYPKNLPVILPELQTDPVDKVKENLPPNFPIAIASTLESTIPAIKALENLIGATGVGIGSNNWVISGERTVTKKPILANDPHLAVQIPSIWYEVGLHCTNKNAECPYNVAGFSFAGMLGVIVGHSDRIAWGVTNVQSDVMDLYIEKINPNNPNQYEVNGKWVDMQLVPQIIQVAGTQPILHTVRYTRNGPILSDVSPNLQQFPSQPSVPVPQKYAVALRWTALEPSRLAYSITGINRAQNWPEFRTAAKDFDIAAQNLVYADIDGNIGYQMPGKMPIRAQGNGRYPVPGWTDEYEWQSYIDFAKLPYSFNPQQGYIATANNLVAENYPDVITTDWVYGYRAARITEMINQQTEDISIQDVQEIQGDNKNLTAQILVPLLHNISLDNQKLETARKLLINWNFQLEISSPAATLFEVFWKHLLVAAFHDNLPNEFYPDGGDRWYAVVQNLVTQPDSFWWDNSKTPQRETRDQILQQALKDAVTELESLQGKDAQQWNWGKLHTITFRHATLGKSGVPPIEALFNRGAFATAGNGETVNANRWRANKSFEVTDIPSLRMIVDLGNLDESLAIHTPGQSGHAFHQHYVDMVEPWQKIEYHQMLWESETIKANTATTLKLIPKSHSNTTRQK
ncbi:penicillin acylase family protein [Nostoc spongiaeforme FACHB-130]|uniref:Penicillin acylase family protein n=1 Tax=Nostoc spongiaeforme FACHB-130 TaxID=1357510 RepID=A0ABR8FQ98_9NOSO|nr:penicillin acylase family protein [Nostoc spongiaeforme]MBD2593496.1 penicillin acylase family protein [Nostoc spongiaeforme FACHB-130]